MDRAAQSVDAGHEDEAIERGSGVHARFALGTGRLSEFLWGLDWLEHLPVVLSRSGLMAVRGCPEGSSHFIRTHFPELLETTVDGPPADSVQLAKARYFGLSDHIHLRQAGRTVAVFVGAPEDWSTYYCRIIAFLPEARRPAEMRRFAKQVIFPGLVQAGIERLVAETSPVNTAMARWLLDLGYCPTGQRLTERWGALMQYTKYLQTGRLEGFASRFSGVSPRGVGDR